MEHRQFHPVVLSNSNYRCSIICLTGDNQPTVLQNILDNVLNFNFLKSYLLELERIIVKTTIVSK